MNLQEAIEKVNQAIEANPIYGGKYKIEEKEIVETHAAWYIPFVTIHPITSQYLSAGAYNGYIVGKELGDLIQPGSAFPIEKWLIGYELGLLNGPHDLIIKRINDSSAANQWLQQLNLKYYQPELADGVTWKIPKSFTEKMIEERLKNLPCKFKNQNFTFAIDQFQTMKMSKHLEYELVRNTDAAANEIGEKID